jgi:hypothetical protein
VPGKHNPPETELARKARLARIFGDTMPETTSDERDPEPRSGAQTDEWYRANRPPHHGG